MGCWAGQVFDSRWTPTPICRLGLTFLRRPDGHEVGGIIGADTPTDFVYGWIAQITDPFGTQFSIGTPSPSQQG